jgi:crotonobetainyl-CoA:carnitine CoA-transferase CaiB-like acyl-CoA transferase
MRWPGCLRVLHRAEIARLRGDPQARGCEVDLAATEALFRLLDPLAVEHEKLGLVRRPAGNCASYTAPSNMYMSSERVFFSLVASSNPIFVRLASAVGRPEWTTDPRFATNPARVANLRALDEMLAAWFIARPWSEIESTLEAEGIPFSKVYSIEDIERDPQFIAREAIVRLPDAEHGSLPAPCIVPRVPGREMPVPRTGPATGEHNAELLGAYGVDAVSLEALRAQGVV